MAKQGEYERGWTEGLTKFLGVIDSDHAYIHDAIAYTSIINTGSISAAYYIGFTTPSVASGKFIHWRPIGLTTSADYIEVTLYEGDAFTGGTAVTPINRNRLSTDTSDMQAFAKGVTVTPAGVIIQQTGIGTSGNAAARGGGGAGADQEIVLAQDTDYVAVITPAGATIVNGSFFWYEENAGIDED